MFRNWRSKGLKTLLREIYITGSPEIHLFSNKVVQITNLRLQYCSYIAIQPSLTFKTQYTGRLNQIPKQLPLKGHFGFVYSEINNIVIIPMTKNSY